MTDKTSKITSHGKHPASTILVVDDEPLHRRSMERILCLRGYRVLKAGSGAEAIDLLATETVDAILMDIVMPGIDGIETCRRLRQLGATQNHSLTIICISALADRETRLRALDAGADDFLQKPVDEAELRARLRNRLAIQRHCETLHREHQELKTEVDDQVELLGKAIFEINRAHEAVRHFNEEIIFRLCRAAEFRDDETANHVHRVSHYSALIARVVGLDPDRIEALRLASPLHDVGKIGTPDCILRKPGRLDPEEIAVMRRHAEDGHRILHGSDSDLLGLTAEIAWTHHERFDGSGYPRGLKGAEIPLPGRIVAVADVFDALTSRRVYKPAFPKERAVAILREERGKHFDPEIVDGFLSHLSEVLTIMRRFADT